MADLRRPTLGLIVLLTALIWVGTYARRGLWVGGEARYAYVAREMSTDGNWFALRLYGEPYPDKPPLMFWLINVATLFTGGEVNGVSARLPSLLGAVLTLWATARLMERWRDGAAAWRSVAILLTAYLFWREGGTAQIDIVLCGLEMMSLWCFFTATDPGRGRRFIGAYLFLGLALLTKGPPAFVTIAVYLAVMWAGGEAHLLKRGHWWWGVPLACAIPGAWLLFAWRQGAPPEYFAAMFGEKSFGRMLDDINAHGPLYYIPLFIAQFLPWTIFLPAAYSALDPGPLRRRLVTWTLVVIGLFSLSVGKRIPYILLAWPGVAMLVAAGLDGILTSARRWQTVTGWIAPAFLTVLGLAETGLSLVTWSGALPRAERLIGHNPAAPWTLLPCAVLMLAGGGILISWFRRHGLTNQWFRAFAGVMFVHWMLLGSLVLPAANPDKEPPRELIAEARTRLLRDQPIHVYRDQLPIIPLYSGRPGRFVRTPEEVEALLADGRYDIIVFHQQDWEPLSGRFNGRARARPFQVGGTELVWVDSPEPASPVAGQDDQSSDGPSNADQILATSP